MVVVTRREMTEAERVAGAVLRPELGCLRAIGCVSVASAFLFVPLILICGLVGLVRSSFDALWVSLAGWPVVAVAGLFLLMRDELVRRAERRAARRRELEAGVVEQLDATADIAWLAYWSKDRKPWHPVYYLRVSEGQMCVWQLEGADTPRTIRANIRIVMLPGSGDVLSVENTGEEIPVEEPEGVCPEMFPVQTGALVEVEALRKGASEVIERRKSAGVKREG